MSLPCETASSSSVATVAWQLADLKCHQGHWCFDPAASVSTLAHFLIVEIVSVPMAHFFPLLFCWNPWVCLQVQNFFEVERGNKITKCG